jgi:YHS domain-containing protein
MVLHRNIKQALTIAIVSCVACIALAQTPYISEPRVVLKGYDVVAYFTEGKAVKGTPKINFNWDGGRYQFSSEKNKKTFAENPDRYAPQFAGFCTAGMAGGIKYEANPELFAVVDGKLYTFSSREAKEAVMADPDSISRAAKNWQKVK